MKTKPQIIRMKEGSNSKEIWLKGVIPGKLYGAIKILLTHGPEGFGVEISNSAGDVPLSFKGIQPGGLRQSNVVWVYELTPERYEELKQKEKTSPPG